MDKTSCGICSVRHDFVAEYSVYNKTLGRGRQLTLCDRCFDLLGADPTLSIEAPDPAYDT